MIKVGKTDASYNISTAGMNLFSGMIGDYSAVMGNTGGDNRVEFLTRLDLERLEIRASTIPPAA